MGRPATLKVQILTDHDSRGMDSAGRGLDKLAGLAKAAAAAVGVAVVAIGKKAFDEASRLQQAIGAVETVFGQYADSVKAKAEQAADAVGLSNAQYGEMASILGAQLKNMGTAVDELAPKTDELIGLGADLAATFGGTTADAVSALSSLLRGERDPIERYGVSIKQADVEARKAELGLKGLTGEAERQADATATLSLLTEQTADAQGQFAREADTAAGASQRLSAQWDNVLAQIGEWLLPAFVAIATFINDNILPAISEFASSLGDRLGPVIEAVSQWVSESLWPALDALWDILDTVGTLIMNTVVPAFTGIWSWIAEKIVPIIAANLVPVLQSARDNFQTVADKVQGVWDKLQPLAAKLGEIYLFIYSAFAPLLSGAFRLALEIAATAAGVLADAIAWIVDTAVGAYESVKNLISALKDLDGTKVSYQILKQTDTTGKLGGEYGFVYDAAGPKVRSVRDLTAAAVVGLGAAGAAVYPKPGATNVDVFVSLGDGPMRKVAADEYRVQTSRAARRMSRPQVMGA